jgi:hypothetical protein
MSVSDELKAGIVELNALFQYWPSTTPPLAIKTPVARGYVDGADEVVISGVGDSVEEDVDDVITVGVGDFSEDDVDEVITVGVDDSSKDVDEVVTSDVGEISEDNVDEVIMAGVGESVEEDVVEEEDGVSGGSRYKPSITVQSVTEAFPR